MSKITKKVKYLVVIQGAINTFGNSGNCTSKKFNSIENILDLVERFQSDTLKFVLSTWENEPTKSFDGIIPVIKSRDPGSCRTYTSFWRATNDFRQALSSYNGICEGIRLFEPEYVLKIRTDISLNILDAFAHMEEVNSACFPQENPQQTGFLFFPNMLMHSPYSVGDFYIGGCSGDMTNFFAAQIKLKNHSISDYRQWTHSEIIYKYCVSFLYGKINLEFYKFFPIIGNNFIKQGNGYLRKYKFPSTCFSLWNFLLLNYISLFPKSLISSLSWRGERYLVDKHDSGVFFEDWLSIRLNYLDKLSMLTNKIIFVNNKNNSLYSIFLHFNIEKLLEIKSIIFIPICVLAKITRSILMIISGYIPMSNTFDFIKIQIPIYLKVISLKIYKSINNKRSL